ncbi:ATP-binding protein [Paenibacillus hodogayensis]
MKLYVGFGTVLALMLVLSYGGLMLLNQLNDTVKRIVNDNYAGVKMTSSLRGEVDTLDRSITAYMMEYDTAGSVQLAKTITESRLLIERYWNELGELDTDGKHKDVLMMIFSAYSELNRDIDQLIRLNEAGRREQALDYYNTALAPLRSVLFEKIHLYSSIYQDDTEEALEQSRESYRNMVFILAGFEVVIFLVAAVIAVWVFRSVTGSLGRIADVMDGVTGSEPSRLPLIAADVHDELGIIARAYNRMAAALDHHSQSVEAYQRQLEAQNWHKTKVAEFSAMFQNAQDDTALAQSFLDQIAVLTGAGFGVLYGCRSENGDGVGLLKLASYAGEGKASYQEKIAIGEGLVGQCVLQNQPIALESLPDKHVRISSGLGDTGSANLLLTPIPYDGKAIAVLELASHEPFEPARVRLLEEVAGLLGIAFNSASAYRQIRQLLAESQLNAEELQAQAEELQMQQEEMRTLNERLELQYAQADGRNKELENIRLVLEESSRQAQLSSRYKTEFLANVSHELRTPLNSLLLLAQLLSDNKQGNLSPKQLEYARTIYSSGSDLLALINDLLDLSKIEAGKAEIVPDSISIGGLAETIERQFRPLASQKGLDLHIDVASGEAETAIVNDIQKLRQIIGNLMSNAIKFTEKGGVSVSLHVSKAGGALEYRDRENVGGVLTVSVADTGIGIPPDKREMIFESFRQADGTTSRKYGGTGLGLAICRELASLLGGKISLDSKEGEWSVFTLQLPQMDAADAALTAGYEESAAASGRADSSAGGAAWTDVGQEAVKRLKNRTILLIDDDMRNIFALTGVLETYGMVVMFAENGREGLKMLERHPRVDLILMDIMMPQMDGYEAIRAIRNSGEPYRNVPIIALTAKAMKTDRDKCLEAGADDYISKPVRYEQLLSLLRVWLHG